MISYDDACKIIEQSQKFGIVLGLERMEYILEKLNNPEKQLKAIHVAGTNGKGSTIYYIKSMLMEAGYTVGTYTSPQIMRINDKIQMNGNDISNDDFATLMDKLLPIIDELSTTPLGSPTEFEIETAIALLYFATVAQPDYVLLETGLGGRLDSTNVIVPLVSVITNIGHDHMNILGNTISEIAFEKAGIIKKNVPVVSGCKQVEAKSVIKKQAMEQRAQLYQLGEHFHCQQHGDQFTFKYEEKTITNIKTSMLGHHQQENAALATMVINVLRSQITDDQIRLGIKKANIPNRIQIVQKEPTIIFDGGHNREGIEALAETVTTYFPKSKITVIFCAMKDKDIVHMIEPLQKMADELILTTFPYERAMNPNEVHARVKRGIVMDDWVEAYENVKRTSKKEDVIVITGSLYFLAAVRSKLNVN